MPNMAVDIDRLLTHHCGFGVNTSTDNVNVLVSDGSNAPTPIICRSTSSPRSFRIDMIIEYSHTSSAAGGRIVPSTFNAVKLGNTLSADD